MKKAGGVMYFAVGTLLILAIAGGAADSFEEQRAALLNRKREVIYNTDGCDALYFPGQLAATRENFLAQRLIHTRGSKIDTLSYCPQSAGFGHFTARTKSGDMLLASLPKIRPGTRNVTGEFLAQGTDPLRLARDYAKGEKLEFFLSIRVNDTHDAAGTLENPDPLLPEFKRQHPEFLFGAPRPAKRPPYGNWSAVDFSHAPVRERMKNFVRELVENYDVDGIEYDFMRHMQLFRTVANGHRATVSELALMTGLMVELRGITEAIGRKRGRPVLVAIRVPDALEYCRGVGIDLENWLAKKTVDLLITTSYFQFNPWDESARIATQYGVKFYPSLDESRIRNGKLGARNGDPAYAARALDALRAGAAGIYYFNLEGRRRMHETMRGSRAELEFADKLYFATVRGSGGYQPGFYLADGAKYKLLPVVEPQAPVTLTTGKPWRLPLWIGDDPKRAEAAGRLPQAEVRIQLAESDAAAHWMLGVNGGEFVRMQRQRDQASLVLDSRVLRPGKNEFVIRRESAVAATGNMLDFAMELRYPATSR